MSDFNSNPYPPRWVTVVLVIAAVVAVGLILFAVL